MDESKDMRSLSPFLAPNPLVVYTSRVLTTLLLQNGRHLIG